MKNMASRNGGETSAATPKSAATKHAPGPWEVRFRFGRETTVSGRQRYPICDTGTAPLGQANHAREEANARLIAAAPDMLEALKGAIGALEFSRDYHTDLGNAEQAFCQDKLDAALNAIRKAEAK